MREIIWGFCGSMLIYLALPDVGLTKPQTVLVLIIGCMICTAAIWTVQEVRERYKRKRFREWIRRTTLWR